MRRFSRSRIAARARERAVALVVPEPVVHLLEVVEVADQDAQLAAAAPGPLELQLERLLEAAPVQQPGEGVGAGRVGQPPDGQVDVAPQRRRSARMRPAARRAVSSHSSSAWSGLLRRAMQHDGVAGQRERHLRERRARG